MKENSDYWEIKIERKLEFDFDYHLSYDDFIKEKKEFIVYFRWVKITKTWIDTSHPYIAHNEWLYWIILKTWENDWLILVYEFILSHIQATTYTKRSFTKKRHWSIWRTWLACIVTENYKWADKKHKDRIESEVKPQLERNGDTKILSYLKWHKIKDFHIADYMSFSKKKNWKPEIKKIEFTEEKTYVNHLIYFIFLTISKSEKKRLYLIYTWEDIINPFLISDKENLWKYLKDWCYVFDLSNAILESLLYIFSNDLDREYRENLRDEKPSKKRDLLRKHLDEANTKLWKYELLIKVDKKEPKLWEINAKHENLKKIDSLRDFAWEYGTANKIRWWNDWKEIIKFYKGINLRN